MGFMLPVALLAIPARCEYDSFGELSSRQLALACSSGRRTQRLHRVLVSKS